MKHPFRYMLAAALLLLTVCTACSDGSDAGPDEAGLPVTIRIPADNVKDDRLPGDPGTDGGHPKPTHLCLYVALTLDNATTVVECNHYDLDETAWALDAAGTTYVYQKRPLLRIPASIASGRVMAVASQGTVDVTDPAPATLDALRDLQFNLPAGGYAAAQSFLKDLYANPWNDADNGRIAYVSGKTYEATVTCYHVAARADVHWEVHSDAQATRSVNRIDLNKLPDRGYVFLPTENAEGVQQLPVLGAEASALVALTPANRWAGRVSAYVLQRSGAPLDWTLTEEGGAAHAYTTLPVAADNLYTGWYYIAARLGYPSGTGTP